MLLLGHPPAVVLGADVGSGQVGGGGGEEEAPGGAGKERSNGGAHGDEVLFSLLDGRGY